MVITAETITGRAEAHLSKLTDGGHSLHCDVVDAWLEMQTAAAVDGFDLQIASGFRSFDRQLAIWNAKASGARQMVDDTGQLIEIEKLVDREKMRAILRWTALPGASRHHWGTDMDVWDAAAVSSDYALQLVPAEYLRDGPFFGLSEWLGENASKWGFFRPYAMDRGGVAPEPWHLSFQPVACQFEEQLTTDVLSEVLENSGLKLKAAVLASLNEIFDRYVRVPSSQQTQNH